MQIEFGDERTHPSGDMSADCREHLQRIELLLIPTVALPKRSIA
jgi:hypothetical protein